MAALVIEDKLLLGGAILVLALLAAVASRRLQLPLLITFLALGMLLGSEGLGGIYFDNAQLARSIGILALIAILFEGGLSTDWPDIRPVAVPAVVLSTLGVVVTAAVTALPRTTSSTSSRARRCCSARSSARPTRRPCSRRCGSRRCVGASRRC